MIRKGSTVRFNTAYLATLPVDLARRMARRTYTVTATRQIGNCTIAVLDHDGNTALASDLDSIRKPRRSALTPAEVA